MAYPSPASFRHHEIQTLVADAVAFHKYVSRPMRRRRASNRTSATLWNQLWDSLPSRNEVPAAFLSPDYMDVSDSITAHPRRRRRQLSNDISSTGTTLLPEQWIESSGSNNQEFLDEQTILQHLRTRYFVRQADDNKGPEICVVCQDEYQENDRVGRLSCGHEYHVDCVTKWLLQNNVCAVCKSKTLPIG